MVIEADILKKKYNALRDYIKSLEFVSVAFSSGVDSTFLLKVCKDVLGTNVIAFTASSHSFPKRELEEAKLFCQKNDIQHIVFNSEELDIEGFSKNPKNRCYLCKKELFEKIIELSKNYNIKNIVEGSNTDDNGDYRPGLIAVSELGILSPLRKFELSKEEIRILSKELGLPTANKQSFACLSSRFVYGETITEEKLDMVDKAEQLLLDFGFHQVRVRIHDKLARIEVLPNEFEKVLENREIILSKFKEYGFLYVSMDLYGYKTGSMNATLNQ
jgi:uncharacterized protein